MCKKVSSYETVSTGGNWRNFPLTPPFRNKKKKIQMDWSHIKKRELRDTEGCPTLEPSRKQEERKTEKQLEKIGNQGNG